MKLILKSFLVICFITLASCRDTKKEDEALQKAIDEIETIESEVEKATDELQEKVDDLEDALKELDSI